MIDDGFHLLACHKQKHEDTSRRIEEKEISKVLKFEIYDA